jgi:hypothetical protein
LLFGLRGLDLFLVEKNKEKKKKRTRKKENIPNKKNVQSSKSHPNPLKSTTHHHPPPATLTFNRAISAVLSMGMGFNPFNVVVSVSINVLHRNSSKSDCTFCSFTSSRLGGPRKRLNFISP